MSSIDDFIAGDIPFATDKAVFKQTKRVRWHLLLNDTLSGYTFSPPSRSYGSVSASQSKQELRGHGAAGANGNVHTSGGRRSARVVMNGLPGNPTTDASGNYSAQVPSGWSGAVTPTLSGYTFSPPSRSYGQRKRKPVGARLRGHGAPGADFGQRPYTSGGSRSTAS